jgi:hypothetical protein
MGLQLAAGPVQADTLTSADFSFGIGATGDGAAVWTTSENSSNNSPTTQGDFMLSPAATSSLGWSTAGCTFANRSMLSLSEYGMSGMIADPSFGVPIVASYKGPTPANADPVNPNYQLTLEITGLGIYVGDFPEGVSTSGGVAQWTETTAGHSQASPLTTISPRNGNATLPSNYTRLLWDPTDYSVTLSDLNGEVTRSFTIPVSGPLVTDYRYADGIEVFGRVHLSYNAVPEPSTVLLACSGLVGLLAYAWRKRK